jgi:DNA-binding transcriptional MerR regulator
VGDGRLLRIGEVAEAAGTTPRTIRYYEEIGLLPAASARVPGSHRLYELEEVERLRELLDLKDLLGISLEELRELAIAESARNELRREWQEGVDDPVRRREILAEAVGHIDRQLALIRRRRDQIAALEKDLTARRRSVGRRLRELERSPSASS